MAIKEISLLIACLHLFCGPTYSFNITCNHFEMSYVAVGSVYLCYGQLNQNSTKIDSKPLATIDSVSGSHTSGKSNADVTCFWLNPHSIHYFPRNVDKIFENLKMIWIVNTGLKEIQQSDLRSFSKLVYLCLERNDIEFLENGLFAYNPELVYIDFMNNKIIYIGAQVFGGLNELSYLYFGGNNCISMNAVNNKKLVNEVINQTKVKCHVYTDKLTVLLLKSKISNAEFELSKVIIDSKQVIEKNTEDIENMIKTSHEDLKSSLQNVVKVQNENSLRTISTQTSVNQLINIQSETCSSIAKNVSRVNQLLVKMSQDLTLKLNSSDIENIINNNNYDAIKWSENIQNSLGMNNSTLSTLIDKTTKLDASVNEIIKQKLDDIQRNMTDLRMTIKADIEAKSSKLNESLEDLKNQINRKTSDLDRSIKDLKVNLNEPLLVKEANIINDVNTKTLYMNERIINIETAMSEQMKRIKNDLASEMSSINNNVSSLLNIKISALEFSINTKILVMNEKISNLTSILQDFIKLSTRSSNQFQSELNDRLLVTNYKIDKNSIIQDYSKSMLIGACALLATIVLIIIYKKIIFRSDDQSY